jgi:hypothetical protein
MAMPVHIVLVNPGCACADICSSVGGRDDALIRSWRAFNGGDPSCLHRLRPEDRGHL